MPINRRIFLGAGLTTAAAFGSLPARERPGKPKPVYQMGSRRELFLDDFLVERTRGKLSFELHHPIAREQVIHHTDSWEGTSSSYHSVIQDGDTYRLYYRGFNFNLVNNQIRPTNKEVTCYAESRDGIHWVKPELGLFAHAGSKKNNIIWQGPGSHNFSPFLDQRPGCPANERFKAFGGVKTDGGMLLFSSADGIRWKQVHPKAVITRGAFDSANIGFWDPTIGKYRAYWRYFTAGITEANNWKPAGIRAIRTAVSDDLLTWKDEHDLAYTHSPKQQMYTNNILPYFRAPHILLGFPMRYVERGWSPSMRALPDLKQRKVRAAAHLRYGTAITETQIMASRDGVKFNRWNEAFLPPGIQRPDSWYYAHNDVAWNMVTTKSSLPGAPDELSFYASSGKWHGEGSKLTRHTLRQDGFVSVTSPYYGGELLTRPLTFKGSRLTVNFATSAAGTLKVEFQTPDGKPVKGFTLADADETFGDELDRTLTWRGSSDVSSLAGRPLRLRITLSDTDLYSIKFS
ncbi:MAG: hypothetical protein QF363_08540 [Planctomycetaceae bacterium]|jgi:hypothetical protein|nr:hypothetical protein [Planctomycetaceae bacterium]